MPLIPEARVKARALIDCAAHIQVEDEKPEEALPLFQRAVDLASDWWDPWQRLGSVLHDLKRYQEALDAYDKALGLAHAHFDKAVILEFKAWTLLELGRNAEALEAADLGLALRPGSGGLALYKGMALLRLDRPAEALATYEHSIDDFKTFYPGWVGKGQSLIALRRYEEALEVLNTAVNMSSIHPDAWYYKAVALAQLARYPEALAAVDTALKIQPDYPEAKALRQQLTG